VTIAFASGRQSERLPADSDSHSEARHRGKSKNELRCYGDLGLHS
jgi:hypothetical protein